MSSRSLNRDHSGHSALAGSSAVQLVEAGITGQRDGIGFSYGTVIADLRTFGAGLRL